MKRQAIVVAIVSLLIGGVSFADDDTVVRWDIVNLPPICPAPGGNASAMTHHNNNQTITLTGSGTFEPGDSGEVTGGGTWTAPGTGSGTFKVTGLVSWLRALGGLDCPNDTIAGVRAAGLAVLRIRYNDGSKGVLFVSCRLPGSPASMFEGVAVSKGVVGYVHNVEPAAGVNANRTLFHIQEEDDEDDEDD